MLSSLEKKIKNYLSQLLLIISLPFLLSAMEEKTSLQKSTSQATKIKLTKGQRRKLQRKRAKARPTNQTASEEFYDYFESQLVQDNPHLPTKSLQFFRTYLLFWAQRYNELGILDNVLDTYFKTTQTTPNTLMHEKFSNKETSFLKYSAELAIFGNRNAKIVFKKLLEHGGDCTLNIQGSTTNHYIKQQNFLISSGLIIFDKNKEKNQIHQKRALKNVQEMLKHLRQQKKKTSKN